MFQAGTQRRSVPNFQKAVEMVHTGKLGKLHTMHASVYFPTLDNTWLPPEPQPQRDVVDWNLWLGPAAWRPFNMHMLQGVGAASGILIPGACARLAVHTIDLCQWANQADDTMPIEYEPTEQNIVCTYANGVKLIVDFLPDPFRNASRITSRGSAPVRCGSSATPDSVETGDEGEIVATPDALQKELPDATKRVRGLDVSADVRYFSIASASARQDGCKSRRHAALAHRLARRGDCVDPE